MVERLRSAFSHLVWRRDSMGNRIHSPLVLRFGALLAPGALPFAQGQYRSALQLRPVDVSGKPIPWYTYPAIDLLSALDVKDCRVVEFGAGYSTLWWAARCRGVLAFEDWPSWYEWLREKTRHLPVNLRLVAPGTDAFQWVAPDTYDIMVVDGGGDRVLNAAGAFRLTKRSGLVIIDNSEQPYGPPEIWPLPEAARAAGWMCLPLIGQVPAAARRGCTSICFTSEVRLFGNLPPPHVTQVRRA